MRSELPPACLKLLLEVDKSKKYYYFKGKTQDEPLLSKQPHQLLKLLGTVPDKNSSLEHLLNSRGLCAADDVCQRINYHVKSLRMLFVTLKHLQGFILEQVSSICADETLWFKRSIYDSKNKSGLLKQESGVRSDLQLEQPLNKIRKVKVKKEESTHLKTPFAVKQSQDKLLTLFQRLCLGQPAGESPPAVSRDRTELFLRNSFRQHTSADKIRLSLAAALSRLGIWDRLTYEQFVKAVTETVVNTELLAYKDEQLLRLLEAGLSRQQGVESPRGSSKPERGLPSLGSKARLNNG